MPDQGKVLMPDHSPGFEEANRLMHQPAELDFSQADYKRFYTNHVTSTMSLFEIRAIFSSVQGIDPETEKLVVDETLHVRMSPELALALLQTLRKTLHDYVAMFGSLRPTKTLPPEAFKTDPIQQAGGSVDDLATESERQ
jgi:hypothetical protein